MSATTPRAVLKRLNIRSPFLIELRRPQTESVNSRRGLTLNQTSVDRRATLNGTRTCSVDDCTSASYCRGFCTKHYLRFMKHGDPLVVREVNRAVCVADGCENIARTLNRTLCSTHYSRWKRHVKIDGPVVRCRKAHGTCMVDGCEQKDCGPNGYCVKHYGRIKRNGSPYIVIHQRDRARVRGPEHPRWDDEHLTYHAMHFRIRTANGRASERSCADCGKKAQQWSYTHTDPNERQSKFGAYSIDLGFYIPRCISCHKRFDLALKRNS